MLSYKLAQLARVTDGAQYVMPPALYGQKAWESVYHYHDWVSE